MHSLGTHYQRRKAIWKEHQGWTIYQCEKGRNVEREKLAQTAVKDQCVNPSN